MGLAYALAACGQGVAAYAVPAAGNGVGLAHAIELFVALSSAAVAVVVLRQPAELPGRDMEGEALAAA